MKFFQRLKLAFNNNVWEEYIRSFLRGDDVPVINGEIPLNTTTAMKYTAVFACVRVLSETLASMPMMLYRKKANGEREPVTDSTAYDIMHNSPNGEMSPFSFKESCMMALNLGGNSVCEKLLNPLGEVVGLYPYPWHMITIDRDDANRLIYNVKNGTEERILRRDQVFHIAGPSFDGVKGLSPIEYAASAIRLGLSYEKFGVNFYRNAANASGVFSFESSFSEEAYQRLKKEITANYAGMINTGKPILLEEGGKFQQLTISPADAQLIESKHFQIEDICRIYRVPQHLVQKLDRSTNNNIEHQSLEFVTYTLLPWFKRWEEAANMQILSKQERLNGLYFEFKVDALLRGDAKSRAEAYAAGRQWGWLSVNDIRRLENLPSIANGDIYLQPSNMIEAGKEPTQPLQQTQQALAEEIFKMISERR